MFSRTIVQFLYSVILVTMNNVFVQEAPGETLEDEMGLTGATAEDAEAEYIKKICDHEIVTGMTARQSFLFNPMIFQVQTIFFNSKQLFQFFIMNSNIHQRLSVIFSSLLQLKAFLK